MTKTERLLLHEIKNAYDQLIEAFELEIATKQKLLEDLKKSRREINSNLRNQETIDKRLEELCNFKKAGEKNDSCKE